MVSGVGGISDSDNNHFLCSFYLGSDSPTEDLSQKENATEHSMTICFGCSFECMLGTTNTVC